MGFISDLTQDRNIWQEVFGNATGRDKEKFPTVHPGGALVAEVERWAAGRGLAEVSVRSNVVREESHPFYARLGYVRAKTQHVYRKALPAGASPATAAP